MAVYQRIDQAGQRLPIDERILADTDTLMVFGLDHMVTEQEASPDEIESLRRFLTREGTCLILGPHHDVGVSADLKERQMEYAHHGDPLVPRQQRFGKYTRSVMKGLGVPVENRYGLRPATVQGTRQTVPLSITRDLDTRGWLTDVKTFVFHMHLPHYAVTTDDPGAIHVLARQPIDMSKPHPFVEAGNSEFNMFLWMPPKGERAGDILLADSTIFTTLFGGDESLHEFLEEPREQMMQIAGSGSRIFVAVCVLILGMRAQAQNRGVYPLGMTATNSGVTPAARLYLRQSTPVLLPRSRQRRCRRYADGYRRELCPDGHEYIGLGE